MDNKSNLRAEIIDETKNEISNRIKKIAKIFINDFFDLLEDKVENLPNTIKQLRNNPEMEQKLEILWSEHLFKEGLVPKGYNGLSDTLLISNFRQEGYLEGLYIGYIFAMMALADKNISKDIIITIRDYIRPNLIGNYYKDRDEIINKYKGKKYSWIEK